MSTKPEADTPCENCGLLPEQGKHDCVICELTLCKRDLAAANAKVATQHEQIELMKCEAQEDKDEIERYRIALLRFKSKEITYSFDGRQKAGSIVDEDLK